MRFRRDRQAPSPAPTPDVRVDEEDDAPLLLPGTIAGYRLVRLLARGSRGSLYLGRPDGGIADGGRTDGLSAPRSVALKVFHSSVPFDSVDREIAALSRADSPHLVRLLDLARAPDGRPCLLLERLTGGSLTAYLERVGAPSAGQAVTMLAPLCGALQSLHDHGVAHGALAARSILLDSSGSPVVVGLGHARLRGTDGGDAVFEHSGMAAAGWRGAVLADQRALLQLAESLFARAGLEAAAEAVASLAVSVGLGPADRFLPELEARIFSLGEAEALVLDAVDAPSGPSPSVPARLTVAVASSAAVPFDWDAHADDDTEEPETTVPLWLEQLPFADALIPMWTAFSTRRSSARSLATPDGSAAGGRNEGPQRAGRHRPVLLAGTLGLVLALTLLLLLPSGPGADDAGDAGAAHGLSHASAADTPAAFPSSASPGDSAAGDATPEAARQDDDAAIRGDDPAAALTALARTRDSCFAERSAACLGGVDQAQSAAFVADQSLLAMAVGTKDEPIAGFRPIDATAAAVVQRLGDSAIVSVASGAQVVNDEPASFLLVKGEAGWRIRESFGP